MFILNITNLLHCTLYSHIIKNVGLRGLKSHGYLLDARTRGKELSDQRDRWITRVHSLQRSLILLKKLQGVRYHPFDTEARDACVIEECDGSAKPMNECRVSSSSSVQELETTPNVLQLHDAEYTAAKCIPDITVAMSVSNENLLHAQ